MITQSNGKWAYDLNELAYENGDLVEISGSNALSTIDEDEEPQMPTQGSWFEAAKAFKRILVAPDGTEVSSDAPLPVIVHADNLQYANVRRIITKGGPQRRISQTDYYYKGKQYRQTITYDLDANTEDWSAIGEI